MSDQVSWREFVTAGDWNLNCTKKPGGGLTANAKEIAVAYLIGIYEELKTLNRLLGCQNFTMIPERLRRIERATIFAAELAKEKTRRREKRAKLSAGRRRKNRRGVRPRKRVARPVRAARGRAR